MDALAGRARARVPRQTFPLAEATSSREPARLCLGDRGQARVWPRRGSPNKGQTALVGQCQLACHTRDGSMRSSEVSMGLSPAEHGGDLLLSTPMSAFFPCPSPCPHHALALPRLTSRTNYLHLNPCFGACFSGSRRQVTSSLPHSYIPDKVMSTRAASLAPPSPQSHRRFSPSSCSTAASNL